MTRCILCAPAAKLPTKDKTMLLTMLPLLGDWVPVLSKPKAANHFLARNQIQE